MKISKAKLSRRHFLMGIGAGTAATAAGVVGTKKDIAGSPEDQNLESKKGYQVTEHVRNYYRTAKI
jgi:hypothetical protein